MASAIAKVDRGDTAPYVSELNLATEEWLRFQNSVDNGHAAYVAAARRNYRYYRGDGGQWADDDRTYIESVQGRKCIEVNGILPAVETAVGEQIATRADLSFKPTKGEASAETATVFSKVAKHILDANGYHRAEKQVYKNGLIKRRGYFDVRMAFEKNVNGEIAINDRDPLHVIPDIYADSYDPEHWSEVTLFFWLSLDKIEQTYGAEAAKKVALVHGQYEDTPNAEEFRGVNAIDGRVGMSNGASHVPFYRTEAGERRYRVLERQYYRMDFALSFVDPRTGDIERIPSTMNQQAAVVYAQQNGLLLQKMNFKRVKWRVSTRLCLLHDDWSPYRTFTIIPFFYLFDYGDTLGMVDNAIGPQDLQNKALSSELHILTSVSNSGWKVPHDKEKSTLIGMTDETLQAEGMSNGLVINYDKDIGEPTKILPNSTPTGFDRLSEKGAEFIKSTTGMTEAEQGLRSPEVSGVAVNAKAFQSKLGLADSQDNMQHTRTLLGRKIVELLQDFYTAEQVFKITGTDAKTGKETEEVVTINQVDPFGRILNDITVGEYEVEVSSVPVAATFAESQSQQLLALRQAGVMIPDDEIIRRSNLSDKYELAERMSNPDDGGVGAAEAKVQEAQLALLEAKRKGEIAKATNTNVQAMFGATNAGKIIALTPGIAPLADEILKSSGLEDANAAPLVPAPAAPLPGVVAPPVPVANTSPNFPPQADSGINRGIEGGIA